MPKIDVERLNAPRPKSKPSENPPEIVRTPLDDGVDPMEVDRTSSRRINDPRIIAACHCGAEYETDYSASIDSLPVPSIDNTQDISIDITIEESVDSSQREWESDYYNPAMAVHTMHTEEYDEDYEEEHAIEQKAILDEEDRLLHHSSWKKKSPSIDRDVSTSIDTQLHQPASTDITYYQSIDTNIDYAQDGHYSIGSWADDRYHESFAVEISYRDQGDDELHEAAWERTRFSHPFDRASRPSIDIDHITSIDIRPKPKTTVSAKPKFDNQYLTPDEFGIFRDPDGYAKAIDGRTLHVSREDIADILQTANGADNLFVQQHKIPENQQKVAKEFHDTIGGIDKCFKEKKFYWEEKDEYGIYRNDQGYARDVDGHTIRVHNNDIRRFLERSSRDEPNYICPPKHASSFTQTKLVPEIYTKDEINEMFYGVYGEQEKNKGDFRMKLDGVYYALNDSISWNVLEIGDDFGAFWRYLEQAPEMTIEIDNRILEIFGASTRDDHRDRQSVDIGELESIDTQVMVSIDSEALRSPFGHSRLEAQDFTILQDCP
ncbi:hypothetical protein DY000_02059766 [Brassica cretica]|uniref:Uncharacterized protein n=1 Tax=Brassica cretica TaxID=69181 RepID=A0ABQ7AQG6_BRACR|nr:hypothetical protein DY000_02059766 [Brassica cretica]